MAVKVARIVEFDNFLNDITAIYFTLAILKNLIHIEMFIKFITLFYWSASYKKLMILCLTQVPKKYNLI